MAARQKPGLRKTNVGVRKPGRYRREALLRAAYDLLCEHALEDITFLDIAGKAGVPEGSAYHFFANRYDVFMALSDELDARFVELVRATVPARSRGTWQDMVRHQLTRVARLYNDTPPARKLLIGGTTPPVFQQQKRIRERVAGQVSYEVYARYFEFPELPNPRDIFFYYVEVTHVLFSLSVIEHDRITRPMLEEAVRAGIAYLGTYLPETLPAKPLQRGSRSPSAYCGEGRARAVGSR